MRDGHWDSEGAKIRLELLSDPALAEVALGRHSDTWHPNAEPIARSIAKERGLNLETWDARLQTEHVITKPVRDCYSCGEPLLEDARYCSSCGHDVSEPPRTTMFCTACGIAIPITARFCHQCGHPTDDATGLILPASDVSRDAGTNARASEESRLISSDVVDDRIHSRDEPSLLLSLKGRVGRGIFWAVFLGVNMVVFAIGLTVVLSSETETGAGVAYLIGVLSGVPLVGIYVKRAHDFGASGWTVLLLCIPVVNVVWFLTLGMVRGTAGVNKYGWPRG